MKKNIEFTKTELMDINRHKESLNLSKNTKKPFVTYVDTDSVGEDSIIQTGDGKMKIKDLFQLCLNSCRVYKSDAKETIYPLNIKMPFYDENTDKIKFGECKFIYRHKVDKQCYKITIENGSTLIITEDHSLMVMGSDRKLIEKKTKNVLITDIVLYLCMDVDTTLINKFDKKLLSISKIEKINYDGYVYDVGMKETPNTFFANNILVHNSVFVAMQDEKVEDIDTIFQSEFNEVLRREFIDKYNPTLPEKYNLLELEHENHLDYYFSGGVKKRYYCIRSDGSTYIKGLSIIRKDTPHLLKKELNDLSKKIVMDKIKLSDIIDLFDKIKTANLVEIGISKGFGKNFEDYDKTIPQHVKAAVFANSFDGININSTDKPYMFFVKSYELSPTKKDPDNIGWVSKEICLMEEHFDIFQTNSDTLKLDYIEFFNRQVISPVNEFIYSDKVKVILVEFMDMYKDFIEYKKFFNRVKTVAKKLKDNKKITIGIYKWVLLWDYVFGFSEITELTKQNILKGYENE